MTANEVDPQIRKRIDARLDEIDRVLFHAEMSWSERRNIVGEVETQVYELLARRGDEPTEADVLEVLAGLDPPATFVPDELRGRPIATPATAGSARPSWKTLTVSLAIHFLYVVAFAACLLFANGVFLLALKTWYRVLPTLFMWASLAWLNVVAVRRAWAWSATCEGRPIDEVRKRLAAWLWSANGSPAT